MQILPKVSKLFVGGLALAISYSGLWTLKSEAQNQAPATQPSQPSRMESFLRFVTAHPKQGPQPSYRELYPAAPPANPDKFIYPPGEEIYIPVTPDGLPVIRNVESTVNYTETLNRFYYKPTFDGEVWCPFDQISVGFKTVRVMTSWPEYDQFSQMRRLNGVHKWMERWSGFGP